MEEIPGAPGEKGAPSIQPGNREPIPNDEGVDYSLRDNDLRKHLTDKKKKASWEPEDSLSYSREFSNSNLKAQSKYKPLIPEAVINREEFDLMKHRFDEQVEALKARCEKKESPFDDDDLGESPFTSDIMEAPIPPKFKTPTMKPYDGSKDPKDYVEVFEGLMDFQAATDAIKCLAFQIALTGSARLWCRRLPARSISTYSQLRKEFIGQFSFRHYDRKTATHLATIRQKEDETLTVKLGEEAPATFAEVLQNAKKVIDGQELLRTKTDRPEKQIDQKRLSQKKRKDDSKSKDKGSSSSGSRTEYRRSESGPSRSRPYERCWELKRQIEDLIQDSYFKKFVGKPRSNSVEKKEERKRSRTPPRREDRPAVINTIFGGPSGGQFENKRKELACEARRKVSIIREQKPTCSITFKDTDLEGVHLPHNDALVIAPLIDHVLVRRVLVDGGASANILSLPTYLALRGTRSQLKKSPTPLVGFSAESVSPEGCIDLPVTIGQDSTQVTQMAEFVVIDGRLAYNAIFERPIIHSFQAVPSILHQVLKYSTPNGVGTVRGEQKTSRECYASALKRSSVCALEEQTSQDDLPREAKGSSPHQQRSSSLFPCLALKNK
ncbi:uncharacterized protein LOC111022280 [Momordica charantia]|uniref:Uncharacterized protein LOC111022280 n=1 Tax=Momordica charantia TaxID=3673 RepID=A0A6J1DPC9_MOMCH|nr:uncharacterized protein LOC111022280 [Momordica charantia]